MAVLAAAQRLQMHTATYHINSETAQTLDRRIIAEESRAIFNRLAAILSTLAEE